MKQDRITKLYEELTNKERAVLAFRYMTDVNEIEADRVAMTVPRQIYKCLDKEYSEWLSSISDMACFWAIEHWKMMASMSAALGAVHIMIAHKRIDEAKVMLQTHEKWESRLLALDNVLEAVCNEHGINPGAVRHMAGTTPFEPLCVSEADSEYQITMQENLSRLLGDK